MQNFRQHHSSVNILLTTQSENQLLKSYREIIQPLTAFLKNFGKLVVSDKFVHEGLDTDELGNYPAFTPLYSHDVRHWHEYI